VKGRLDLHVVARFLDALMEGPQSRSRLQRAVAVNYDIFVRYLALLVERGYLADAEERLSMTAEGQRLRNELRAWLETLFGTP
jgi:predicted transcriptional regulator